MAVAATLAVAAAAWWLALKSPAITPATPAHAPASPALSAAAVARGGEQPVQPAAPTATALTAAASVTTRQASAPLARSTTGRFESDAAGRLVLDERTRLAVEALVALTPADQLAAALEAELQGLPPQALAAARELVQRFEAYQEAQRQTFPPGRAPLVPQDGLAELATLSAMRVSYFGREPAQQLFGAEETVTRRLLTLMRDDTSPRASMEELALRAQARYDLERSASAATRGR